MIKSSCKYKDTCKKYSKTSYTCNNLGGNYCGVFRTKEHVRGKE
jgi:hypothetical protein